MSIRSKMLLALSLFASLLLSTPGYSGETGESAKAVMPKEQEQLEQQVQQQEQMRQQHQVEQTSGSPSIEQGKQQHRNANTGEAPMQGLDVREGPYGDKQYHQRQGSPQKSGKQAAAQKKGS